ncbi:hypothetical protein ACFX5U_10485 [Sphingobacterium sp. SG20118]|uniref:hypothetical protein n=1 Tax=Sphingobacterium sp. SG20118 TaxID=3367156 RepID=UPI0037DFC004
MKRTIITSVLILFYNLISAQSIKGTVEIDMKTGLINCSFELYNLPEIKNYKILLNKGMNIKYFKDSEKKIMNYDGHYDGKMKGEANEYSFRAANGKTLEMPLTFQVDYKGAFPIYLDSPEDFGPFDYKGIIAFNGKTLRAADQTKWYPILYDVDNDKLIDKYIYDITFKIKNSENNTIFINGNVPQKTNEHQFVSNKASTLLIFIGNYDFTSNNAGYLLNFDADEETVSKIFDNIEAIKKILAINLKSEFKDKIYVINHKAVNKRKLGSSWAFNDYPAFAFTDLDPSKLLNENGQFVDWYLKFFGHELAHNYFGTNVLSGKLSWFWLESFAEYLSYNVTEDFGLKGYLKETLVADAKKIESQSYIPLSEITDPGQINESYRYILAPLMLKCFEDTFGRDKANLVLRTLLKYSLTHSLTLEHFDKAVSESGIKAADYEVFKIKYITSKDFKENIISHIMKQYN